MLVVDTSALLAYLRGSRRSAEVLSRYGEDEIIVPSLVAWELWKGADTPSSRDRVDVMLADLTIEPLSAAIARLAGELHLDMLRRGRERSGWDLLIAAHALYRDAPLATADKGFDEIEGLSLLRIASR